MNAKASSFSCARCFGCALLLSFFFAPLVFADGLQTITHFPTQGPGPGAGLATDGAKLYGTAQSPSGGSVFSVNKDGTGLQNLHIFSAATGGGAIEPERGLTLGGNTLYGTTAFAGSGNRGTVFSVGTNGLNFQTLHTFSASESNPTSNLTLAGGKLYGTSELAGPGSAGQVYSMNTDGTGYQIVHQFAGAQGVNPLSAVALVGGSLYGTTNGGGANNGGTLYKMNPDGSNFQVLFSFPNGTDPLGDLLVSGNTVYGMTNQLDGVHNRGGVFSVGLDGSNYQLLHAFNGTDGQVPIGTSEQVGGMVLAGNTLYGTTANNAAGLGEVFSMQTDGSNFQVVHAFANSSSEGHTPYGDLLLSGNIVYGTTEGGGAHGSGTIFALAVPEPSSVVLAGIGLVTLTWAVWRRRSRGK